MNREEGDRRGPTYKREEGRGGGLLLSGTEGREGRREGRKEGEGNSPQSQGK